LTKALITGCTGQDGSYLAELLLTKGYEVHGLVRRSSNYAMPNLVNVKDKITIYYGDLGNTNHIHNLIYQLQPDELYNLASQSDVGISFKCPEYTGDVTGLAVTRLLEAVRTVSPKTKFYQASTSELFGNAEAPQNENTPMVPRSPYAIAKLYAHNMVRLYRESYGMFACSGILFNHESPRRGLNFVTRKVTYAVANYTMNGKNPEPLRMGNLSAMRDWGYAPDYVEAMWRMLQQPVPGDYVIGTGQTHSVEDLLATTFSLVDLDWHKFVEIDKSLLRPAETNLLSADYYKAKEILNWEPKVKFKELIKIMLEADIKAVANNG